MRTHLIFGAGLIGCYLGGVFTSLGLPTKLVCRSAMKSRLSEGMVLTDYQNNRADISELDLIDPSLPHIDQQPVDVLWLTVKCTDVEAACADIAPYVGADTVIMCCQNGLGSDHSVKQSYPNNTVLRVMVPFNVVELGPGKFHRGSEGVLSLEASPFISDALCEQIKAPLLPVACVDDMDSLLWAKLQLNLGNSMNALADMPVKAMLEQRKYRLEIAAMMRELLSVTDKLNITLPRMTAIPAHWLPAVLSLPDILFSVIAGKMLAIDPNVRTSMWWDLSQGKKTEVDHLNGAIVKLAEQLGLDCPRNKEMMLKIKRKENERVPISF